MRRPLSGPFAATLFLGCGTVLLVAAFRFDTAWFDRHCALPGFWPPPSPSLHRAVLLGLALAGSGCLAAAAIAPRVLARPGAVAAAARIAAALGLAVLASEGVLRLLDGKTTIWRAPKIEFRIGKPDARYGWVLLPRRSTVVGPTNWRPVRYTIDAWGDRAATVDHVPDLSRPTILVAGESVAMGHDLEWPDTLAGVLERDLGIQIVNVAVGGYGTDQAALRALDMLARLEHPVAVVQTFLPVQLQRNVQDYRPRLVLRDGSLVLAPAASGPFAGTRLRDLLVNELPVLWEDKLQESLAVTGAVVRDVAAKARARGAKPLFLLPEIDSQRGLGRLVRTLFEDQGIPAVVAKIDSAHIMPYDGHPDAEATRAMAGLVERALGLQVHVAR
ncbi:MAG: hypothetical protein ACJ79W_22580 [Myxococcales bacterium]